MSSTEPVERRSTATRHAVVLADDRPAVLASLGAAFDDLVVLDDTEVDQLVTAGPDTVVVVVGPMSERVRETVVNHVATRPGALLAVGTESGEVASSVPAEELDGLRILGSGHLGALAVIWWAAADAVVDVGLLNDTGRPATPLREDADAAFVAGAHERRSRRGPRVARVALPAAPAPPPERPALVPTPQIGVLTRLRSLGRYRMLLAFALLVVGATIGAVVVETLSDRDVLLVLVLIALAVVVVALALQARATRALSVQLREVTDRTNRIDRDLGKQVRQLGRRLETTDTKLQRVRERLRQLEARLAIVSTASVNFERSRTRAAEESEPERPADA